VGRNFLALPYYSQRTVFASPVSAFFIITVFVCVCVLAGSHSGILWCYDGSVCGRDVCSGRSVCLYILEVDEITSSTFLSSLVE